MEVTKHVRQIAIGGTALGVALFLSACSVKERIHLFNNSTELVTIHIKDRMYDAEPGDELSFVYDSGELSVKIGDCSVVYRTSFRLPAGYRRTGWFRSHIWLQLEKDRRVFVLRADDYAPIQAVSYPQPEGFPLVPEFSDACIG